MKREKFKRLSVKEKELIIESMLSINNIYNNPVDLSICEKDDILVTKTGGICRYYNCGDSITNYYDHMVIYPDGSIGTRVNDGHVFKNISTRLEYDHDIVNIIKIKR